MKQDITPTPAQMAMVREIMAAEQRAKRDTQLVMQAIVRGHGISSFTAVAIKGDVITVSHGE